MNRLDQKELKYMFNAALRNGKLSSPGAWMAQQAPECSSAGPGGFAQHPVGKHVFPALRQQLTASANSQSWITRLSRQQIITELTDKSFFSLFWTRHGKVTKTLATEKEANKRNQSSRKILTTLFYLIYWRSNYLVQAARKLCTWARF